ncbi:MAG: G5 domain-containing protein [Anaerolineae bacterium]|nr:G5 domain-containing protein [Anaerolineae bacterium]
MMLKFRYLILLFILILSACRPNIVSNQVTVHVDGRDIPLSTNVLTVREALEEADVTVGTEDRVQPDLWVEIQDGMTVRVIRVQEEVLVEREMVAYTQQTIKSEALPVGERKLLQAGQNGEVEVTYRLRFEDGVEVARTVLQRAVVKEPSAQIIAVGVEGVAESVGVEGTITYLNGGNAWVMRGESGGRHAVTLDGNLDGQVFALSPDGSYLLYSVPTDTVVLEGPFNALYLLNIRLIDEKPVKLSIDNVLGAEWSPDGRQIAYTTGIKSSSPGWKANNDLWLASVRGNDGEVIKPDPKRLLPANTTGAYSWWPMRLLWSPDGDKIAYARADEIGWVEVKSRRAFPLASFAPLSSLRDWVWIPHIAWSSDNTFVIGTVHGLPPEGQTAESSQRFDVWAFSLNGEVRARLVDAAGMWAALGASVPGTATEGLLSYAQSYDPFNSYESRYTLWLMDRDGSNKRDFFPPRGQIGLVPPVEYAWSPKGAQMVVLYLGDLYLVDVQNGQSRQLTGDGQCVLVDWE